jgi:hypothetical protein
MQGTGGAENERAVIGNNSRVNQTVIRSNPETGFTVLANAFLQDPRLSYETKGLLAELLSRPDDWEIRAENIVKSGKAGRDKVWRMLREAEELGYAASRQARTERGKFQKLDYIVTDDPKLLIDRAAREIETLMSPLTENPSAVIPFPEKASAAVARKVVENQGNEAAHGKPVNGEPRTEKPLTGQPCTANPQHTKERYIQTTELTKGPLGKLAVSIAAGFTVATPAAAAAGPPAMPPAEQVQQASAECWQTPRAQQAAALDGYERRAQRQVWITPTGMVEVAGDFKTELAETFPLVDLASGLAASGPNIKRDRSALDAMTAVRRQFGYMQQDALRKQAAAKARQAPEPPKKSNQRPRAWD